MANVGTLTVELAASTAKFQQDLGKATAIAENNAKRIDKAFSGIGKTLAGIGAGISVHAFVGAIQGAIDAADKLNDLSQSTGLAVETLGGLEFAAKQAGTDLEGVAKSVGKLNLQIAAGRNGNKESIETFNALGISVKQLNQLSEQDILLKVADNFAKWEDGADKAGIANRAFGKSYQSIIPLLNEGGQTLLEQIEFYKKWGGVTTETAKRADEFNDTVGKINLIAGAFVRTLTAALLPALQGLAQAFLDTKEEGDGFKGSAEIIARGLVLMAKGAIFTGAEFKQLGTAIGAIAAQIQALSHLDFKAVALIQAEVEADQAKIIADRDKLLAALDNKNPIDLGKTPKAKPPRIPDDSVNAEARKVLENQLRALDRVVSEEKELLSDRLSFLQDYYQSDLLSIRKYYAARRDAADEALTATKAAIDKEIELLNARLKVGNLKPQEREEVKGKIEEATDKLAKAEREAAIAGVKGFRDEEKAAAAFRDKVEELAIRLADLNGDSVTAAAARFDFENRELQKRIDLERQSGDEELRRQAEIGAAALGQLRARTIAQAELNAAQQHFSAIMDDISIEQQRIGIQLSSGAITEIDSLNKLSALNRSRIKDLEAVAAAYRKVAEESSGQAQADAISALKHVSLEIERLASQSDLLADKFRGIFRDSFADALTEAINGTKSLKDAFKDLERSIVQSINRIAAQNIAEAIFGTGKGGGGIGDIIGKLFSSLFGGGKLGGLASGTDNWRGGFTVVGEKGPEIVNLPRGAQVIPNHVLNSRRQERSNNVNISVNVMPGATRASADQAAAAMGIEVRRAMARNT